LGINPRRSISLYGRALAERMQGDSTASAADIAAATAIRPAVADEFAQWGILPDTAAGPRH